MPIDNGISRPRLIIVLLTLILILVLGLVWQASQSIRTNRDTATSVIQDYARLVGDEFTRKAMGEIGYYGFYAYTNSLNRKIAAGQPIIDGSKAQGSEFANYLFVIDLDTGSIEFSKTPGNHAEVQQYLSSKSAEVPNRPAKESGYLIEHTSLGGRSYSFVFAIATNPNRVFGFEVNRAALTDRLVRLFDGDSLLPASLAGGTVTNDYIYLAFSDINDEVLFQSQQGYDPYLLVSKVIGNDYDGVFEGFTVTTAIDPEIADALIIGGLPRSRLPFLLITVVLTIGLLIAAIRQLHRENAVMKLRSDFVSEVSHELRTPLTQIRMFTETLLFKRFKSDDDRLRALEIINRESQRLIHLVENVLQYSNQVGSQRILKIEKIHLAPLIGTVVDEFRPLAEGRDNTLQLQLDEDAQALTDPDALRQILLNFLDNAVKYGPEGQTVLVSLVDDAKVAKITVADQGPGIPEVDRKRIWQEYYRLDRERRTAIAGTGIGLAVVHDLAARQNGTVSVDDSESGGACFTVELPKFTSTT